MQKSCTRIGLYTYTSNTIDVLHIFDREINIIQASANIDHTLLGYIEKQTKSTNDLNELTTVYKPFLINLKDGTIYDFKLENVRQIMIQFLYRKHSIFGERQSCEQLLLFIHKECKYKAERITY